ncbi:hypothetical protein H2199_003033 [Coniosporium tulheliwenetii]|uniref:Uncharacterized protein n=1 Tax=Coniosporium tulheliwenetii TaxID=3383036 RepID=A0ACC2ZEE1_9PEZI|nr:hypothetical protein H2199_003033 [Cladosporium sp. JES 115]
MSFHSSTNGLHGPALWDPVAALQLVNPDREKITCVGYAPTQGRRCRNPIAAHNISAAREILNNLSRRIPYGELMEAELLNVASRLLCVRYHQGQWKGVVEREWKPCVRQELGFYLAERARPAPVLQEAAAGQASNESRSSSVMTVWPSSRQSLSGVVTPLTPIAQGSRTQTPQASVTTPAPNSYMLPSVLSVQPAPREPTQQAVSIPEDHGVLEGSQVQEDAVPEEAAGTELEPPAVVCTTEHVARRSPEDNCVICQRSLAFEPLENLVWCKSQCGKNLHVACWQQWSEYLRRGPSRCVYCRGTWADPCEHDSAEPADSFWSVDDTGLERLFDRQTHIWSIWKAASVDGAGLEHLFDPQAHVWSVWTAGSVEDTGLRHLFDARTHAWSIWKAETVKDTGLRRLFNRQTHAWSLCTAESVDDTGLRRLFRPRRMPGPSGRRTMR